MRTQFNIDSLREIYLISNTASFLYSGFSKEQSLTDCKNSRNQEQLINEFEAITKKEIKDIDELVEAYAIYVTILLFDNDATLDFLESQGNISFEWFPELKHLYLSRLKSFNFNKLEIKDFKSETKRNYSENSINVNDQIIEFV